MQGFHLLSKLVKVADILNHIIRLIQADLGRDLSLMTDST